MTIKEGLRIDSSLIEIMTVNDHNITIYELYILETHMIDLKAESRTLIIDFITIDI